MAEREGGKGRVERVGRAERAVMVDEMKWVERWRGRSWQRGE